jgi:hypothetical protein
MIEFIILFCIVLFIIVIIYFFNEGSVCIIDQTLFPELQTFKIFSNLVQNDLTNAIKTNNWVNDSIVESNVKPALREGNHAGVINAVSIIKNNYEPLQSRQNTIKVFFLYLFEHTFTDNVIACPNMSTLVQGIPNVVSAYIRCVKPNTVSPENYILTSNSYMCTIPLSTITYGEGITVNGEIYEYIDLFENREYLVTDSSCRYQLWNNTSVYKFVLTIILTK